MLDKLKGKVGKLDKGALAAAVVLMFLSWAALPIVYLLIVRKKGHVEEKKTEEKKEDESVGQTG